MPVKTKRLVADAVLIALYTALSYVAIDIYVLRLSFSLFPIIVAGLRFGWADAMIVGAVGGFLNQYLKYGVGPTMLMWMLPGMVEGLIIGLYAQRKNFSLSVRQTVGIVLAGGLAVTTLNTVALYIDARIYQYPDNLTFWSVVLRYVSSMVMTAIYTLITPRVVMLLRKNGV